MAKIHGVITPLFETLLGHDIEKIRSPDETSADGTIRGLCANYRSPISIGGVLSG